MDAVTSTPPAGDTTAGHAHHTASIPAVFMLNCGHCRGLLIGMLQRGDQVALTRIPISKIDWNNPISRG